MLKSSQHHHLLTNSHNNNSNSSFNMNGGGTNGVYGYAAAGGEKCTYCLNSLGNVAIRCAECPNFFLCLKVRNLCFGKILEFFTNFFSILKFKYSVFQCQLRLAIIKKIIIIF